MFFLKPLQHRCFPVINSKFLRIPTLKIIWKRLLLKILSGAAILIFRRYFGNSSLLAFYKIDVLKTSVKFIGNTYAGVSFQ